jgi:hypothetical protein
MVIVLAIGTKVRGSNPAESNGYLRVIKICSMTSFGGAVNPLAPYRKILQHFDVPLSYDRYC